MIIRISSITKRTWLCKLCTMFALYEFTLFNKYSITSLPFCFSSHISSCKNNYSLFQLRAWRSLFTIFTYACKQLFRPVLPGWCRYMEKRFPEKWDFSFLKVRSRLWKRSRLNGTGTSLHVIRNLFFLMKKTI